MEDIVIKDFHLGIGESEFVGNGDIVNCDVNWRKGVVRIQNEAVNTSAGTVTAVPVWIVGNPNNATQIWAIDSSATVYRGTATAGSEQWSVAFDLVNASGSRGGMTIWKDHLLIANNGGAGNSTLYGYGPLSASATLYTISSGLDLDSRWHTMINGQDDIVYGVAGRYIFSLQERDGQDFQAGTSATYALNARALDLPEEERGRSLSELGKYLAIGTWKGQTDIQEIKSASIYLWDRTSDSFRLPIKFSENGIQAMLVDNNIVYAFVGINGKLIATDGTNIQELIPKIPEHILDLSDGSVIEIFPGSMINYDNKIVFGLNTPQDSLAQVWSYNLKTGALIRENTSSRGTATAINVGALFSSENDGYWIGLGNRIDRIRGGGSAQRYSDYSAWVTSPYIKLGSRRKPIKTSEIEINLARPLASGQGIRLRYRTDLSAGFTNVPNGTIDFATYNAIQEQIIPFDLEITNGVQIRAELTTPSSSSTSPELTQIILR